MGEGESENRDGCCTLPLDCWDTSFWSGSSAFAGCRGRRKVTPTVAFRTATVGRWKDVVRVTVLSCSRPRAFTKFDNALRNNVFFRVGYGPKVDSVGKRGRMFSAYRCAGVLDSVETGFPSIPSFFIL